MNPEQLLTAVEHLIQHRPVSGVNNYHVCYFDQKLQVQPVTHTKKPHPVFKCLTPKILFEGMSTGEWDRLLHKLGNFFREDSKCHEPRKLSPKPKVSNSSATFCDTTQQTSLPESEPETV